MPQAQSGGSREVKFSHHTSCPSCGSRDNLGVWSDNHTFCFGCGYRTQGNNPDPRSYFDSGGIRIQPVRTDAVRTLPQDVSTYIPEKPYRWVKQWLTDQELLSHGIGYSQEKESLVFPVRDKQGNLLMYQRRYFGSNPNHPKYLTYGAKDIYHILGKYPSNTVVIVEDLISAIVVSRVENAMPLWGSHASMHILRILSRYYGHLTIWLDRDKLSEAIKLSEKAKILFDSTRVIVSDQDPKYHGVDEVKNKLGEVLDKGTKL